MLLRWQRPKKSPATPIPLVPCGGAFRAGSLAREIAQKGFEPPSHQSATRARNGSCAWLPVTDLLNVLR
jgi:hypothetical protein